MMSYPVFVLGQVLRQIILRILVVYVYTILTEVFAKYIQHKHLTLLLEIRFSNTKTEQLLITLHEIIIFTVS